MILGENGRAGSVASINSGLGFAKTDIKKKHLCFQIGCFPLYICKGFLVNAPYLFPSLSGTKHFFGKPIFTCYVSFRKGKYSTELYIACNHTDKQDTFASS